MSHEEVDLLAANLVTDLHPESLTSVLNKVSANLKTLTVVGMTTVVTTVVVRAGNAQVAVDGTRANAASRYMMIAASVLPIGKQANDAKASTPVAIATGTLLAAGQHANASFTAEDFDRVHVWTLSKVIGCFCVAFLIILAVRVLAGLVPLLSSKERQAKQSDVVRGKGGGEGGEGRTAEDMDKGKERKMLDAARNGRWEEVIHLVKNEGVDANATDFDRHLALWLECYIETMTVARWAYGQVRVSGGAG